LFLWSSQFFDQTGLINYLNRNQGHYQIRVEGLWIG